MAGASGSAPTRVRVWVVGAGTVGQWLLRALAEQADELAARHGLSIDVVGLASAHDGFVHREDGIDLYRALALRATGRPLTDLEGVTHFPTALEGMAATEADALVEVTASPESDGEPGAAHIREALGRGISVATSNKWPVALHGVELARLARERGAAFRAESTVLSGTPLVGPLTEGLAGARPVRLRGVLNATATFILTLMETGTGYREALAEAQRLELAERDPSADVDGHDSAAKLMILAALVFGRQLASEQVEREGIAAVAPGGPAESRARGRVIREVATLEFGAGEQIARVRPVELSLDDPLARTRGTGNAVICEVEPLGEIAIAGPGAGPDIAGQGVLSDLIRIARGS
jgi:homoserine dehydrogenase